MEGDDLKSPMIVASKADKFGVIDIHHNIIIQLNFKAYLDEQILPTTNA